MNKEIMKAMGFGKEVEMVGKGLCPFCKKPVDVKSFRDDKSYNEYRISGICQYCMDEIFG